MERFNNNPIYKSIIEKFAKQQEKGLTKYGEYLNENNDKDRLFFLQHLQEELIDASVYLEGLIQNLKPKM